MKLEVSRSGLSPEKYKVATEVTRVFRPFGNNSTNNEFFPRNVTLKEISRRVDDKKEEVRKTINEPQLLDGKTNYGIVFSDEERNQWKIYLSSPYYFDAYRTKAIKKAKRIAGRQYPRDSRSQQRVIKGLMIKYQEESSTVRVYHLGLATQ